MSLEDGLKAGKTVITTDSAKMIATPGIDVVLEVTGNPAAGVRHVLLVRWPLVLSESQRLTTLSVLQA